MSNTPTRLRATVQAIIDAPGRPTRAQLAEALAPLLASHKRMDAKIQRLSADNASVWQAACQEAREHDALKKEAAALRARVDALTGANTSLASANDAWAREVKRLKQEGKAAQERWRQAGGSFAANVSYLEEQTKRADFFVSILNKVRDEVAASGIAGSAPLIMELPRHVAALASKRRQRVKAWRRPDENAPAGWDELENVR